MSLLLSRWCEGLSYKRNSWPVSKAHANCLPLPLSGGLSGSSQLQLHKRKAQCYSGGIYSIYPIEEDPQIHLLQKCGQKLFDSFKQGNVKRQMVCTSNHASPCSESLLLFFPLNTSLLCSLKSSGNGVFHQGLIVWSSQLLPFLSP